MTTLMAIDPGMSSGIFIGSFDKKTHLNRVTARQIEGGLDALREDQWFMGWLSESEVVVFERFSPRPMDRQYRSEEWEPLRIEGLVRAYRDPVMQDPQAMVLRKAATQALRKQASDKILKKLDWWLTGKDVGCADANDANAAAKHALAYMKNQRHAPTISMLLDLNK